MRSVRWACCALLAALSGCYSYAAVSPDDVQPGTTVRARITPAEAERVGEVIGREPRVLEGALIEREPTSILLEVTSGSSVAGTQPQRFRQRLRVERPNLLEMEVRRLDPWRTAGVVAAAGVVFGYVAVSAFGDGGGAPGSGKGGGDNNRLPLVVFPVW